MQPRLAWWQSLILSAPIRKAGVEPSPSLVRRLPYAAPRVFPLNLLRGAAPPIRAKWGRATEFAVCLLWWRGSRRFAWGRPPPWPRSGSLRRSGRHTSRSPGNKRARNPGCARRTGPRRRHRTGLMGGLLAVPSAIGSATAEGLAKADESKAFLGKGSARSALQIRFKC